MNTEQKEGKDRMRIHDSHISLFFILMARKRPAVFSEDSVMEIQRQDSSSVCLRRHVMRIASGYLCGLLLAYHVFPHKLITLYLLLVYLHSVPPTQQKEKKVTVKSNAGSSIVLKCNPPESSVEPIIHWMDRSEFITFTCVTCASLKRTLTVYAHLLQSTLIISEEKAYYISKSISKRFLTTL